MLDDFDLDFPGDEEELEEGGDDEVRFYRKTGFIVGAVLIALLLCCSSIVFFWSRANKSNEAEESTITPTLVSTNALQAFPTQGLVKESATPTSTLLPTETPLSFDDAVATGVWETQQAFIALTPTLSIEEAIAATMAPTQAPTATSSMAFGGEVTETPEIKVIEETPTAEGTPAAEETSTAETVATDTVVESCTGSYPVGISDVELLFLASDALDYPEILAPSPNRQVVYPDIPCGDNPALVEYGLAWEDADYFEDGHGDVDLSQYHARINTAGVIVIKQIDVNCHSTATKGCALLLINHFGPTVMFRDAEIDNGFTVSGRVWDMGEPENVTTAAQALLDLMTYRMTVSEDGANCSVIDACEELEWHVVIIGDGEVQAHWTGLYVRP